MTPINNDRNRNSRFDDEWDDYDNVNIPYYEDDWDKEEEYDMWADEDENED